MLALILFFVSVFFLARSLLIFLGLLKDPVLDAWSKYGPEEYPYIPLLPVLVWSGMVMLTLDALLRAILRYDSPIGVLGGVVLACAALGYRYYHGFARWNYRLLKYPRWLHDLFARTNRYERRRIAYAWLRLPYRQRLTYNSSSGAFLAWADFVIMSVVWEVEEPPEVIWQQEY